MSIFTREYCSRFVPWFRCDAGGEQSKHTGQDPVIRVRFLKRSAVTIATRTQIRLATEQTMGTFSKQQIKDHRPFSNPSDFEFPGVGFIVWNSSQSETSGDLSKLFSFNWEHKTLALIFGISATITYHRMANCRRRYTWLNRAWFQKDPSYFRTSTVGCLLNVKSFFMRVDREIIQVWSVDREILMVSIFMVLSFDYCLWDVRSVVCGETA